jgi:hypothetical protein
MKRAKQNKYKVNKTFKHFFKETIIFNLKSTLSQEESSGTSPSKSDSNQVQKNPLA